MPPRDEADTRVRALLARTVEADPDEAVQVAAWLDGAPLVDAWASGARAPAIDGDSLLPVFSTSKAIAATAIHRLVDRGTLAYDAAIARWWPEFAAHGKGGITLRHALAHTAGLAAMPLMRDMAAIADWDAMAAAIAAMPAATPPGERRAYHAITYGWILGETARRADGRAFARIIDDEVARPLAIDGLYIGVPDAQASRIVDALPGPEPMTTPNADGSVPAWVLPLETLINRPDARRACVPASNGLMSARAVARHYAALLAPGLLSAATLRAMVEPQPPTGDDVPRYGLGYALYGPPEDPSAVFGHGGYGGSNGFADRRAGLAVAVTRRRMAGGALGDAIVAELRAALAGHGRGAG